MKGATIAFDDAADPLIRPNRFIAELLEISSLEKIKDVS
jgi:hypothetical protein